MVDTSPILLMTTPEDDSYLGKLKPLLEGRQAYQISANPDSIHEVDAYAKSKGITRIISSNQAVLNKFIETNGGKRQSLDNWAGSLVNSPAGNVILFINPLKQLYSVPYGEYISKRFISKITRPQDWNKVPEFSWHPPGLDDIQRWYELFQRALLIACDIETVSYDDNPENPLEGERHTIIRSVAYTGLWDDGNIHTIVLPISEAPVNQQGMWITWMRKLNNLKAPKIFQNGMYDCFHMMCYQAPVRNYLFDTQSLFHSWLSELPKDLAFIAAFLIHEIFYWKDMMSEGGKLMEYNARDGWSTMCAFLALIKEIPPWAIRNYILKFPLWVPCISCNFEGVKVNEETRKKLTNEAIEEYSTILQRLGKWFGEGFNPNSSKQVVGLINFYGSSDITSSGDIELRKFALRHPINGRFANEIIRSRETGKLISTYYKPANFSTSKKSSAKRKSPLLYHGRLLYSLNPDGTDTGRLSCKEGTTWTGTQVQNAPDKFKEMLEADDGCELFELDNKTSESYCTAFISGDANLLETLRQDREEGKDFHIINATRFFGLRYEDVSLELRNKVSKRVNHGATYNMGWLVLLETMGEKAVDEAKKLLKLPEHFSRREVCEHLLESFNIAYPTIKTDFYKSIVAIVETTKKLISPLGWTRQCFGNPRKNRHDLNALIAHVPQNFSVGIINEAFQIVYWKIQVPNYQNFRLKAQIHDSIFGQVRLGYRELVAEAAKLATRPTEVTDIKGIKRIMTIPVSAKIGKTWATMEKFAYV